MTERQKGSPVCGKGAVRVAGENGPQTSQNRVLTANLKVEKVHKVLVPFAVVNDNQGER